MHLLARHGQRPKKYTCLGLLVMTHGCLACCIMLLNWAHKNAAWLCQGWRSDAVGMLDSSHRHLMSHCAAQLVLWWFYGPCDVSLTIESWSGYRAQQQA